MMDNIISNLRKDEMYAGGLKSIPDSILRKFIYGLFENGMHDIGNGMKIIDAYTNSRGVEVLTSLFCSENTSSFLQYGLIEEKVNHITGNNYYEVSGNTLGHSIWLFARKKKIVHPKQLVMESLSMLFLEPMKQAHRLLCCAKSMDTWQRVSYKHAENLLRLAERK